MAGEVASLGVKVTPEGVESTAKSLANLAAKGAEAEKSLGGVEQGIAGVNKAASGLTSLSSASATASRSASSAASSLKDAGTQAANYSAQATKAAKESDNLSNSFSASATSATAMKGAFVAAAAALPIAALMQVTKELYSASAAAERLRTTLDFASGGLGQRELYYVTGLAKDLGLQLSTTAGAYASLAAAARGTSLEGEGARKIFEAVSKASSVMGLTAEQSSGALLALQQMISKGSVQSEELRGQLGERLPGAFQIAARAMGVTTAELGKMLETGQVLASDFLPKFAAQLESELGGAAEKAAQRLDAAVNQFDNAWTRLKTNIGDSGVSKAASGQLSILNDALDGVSERMEVARAKGSGFFGQLTSGGVGVLAAINPLNAFAYSASSLSGKLQQAEEDLKRLEAAGGSRGGNLMLTQQYNAAQSLVKTLREAKAAQDDLLRGSTGAQDAATAGANAQKAAAAREAEEAAARTAYLNADIRQTKLQQKEEAYAKAKALNAKLIAAAEGNTNAQLELQKALKTEIANLDEKYKEKDKGPSAGIKAEESAYEKLVARIKEKIAANYEEIQNNGKLDESAKLRIQLQAQLDSGSKKLTASRRENIEAQIKQLDTSEKLHKEWELGKKQAEEYAKAVEAVSNSADKLENQANNLEASNAAFGKSSLAIEKETQAREKRRLAILKSLGLEGDMTEALEREIAARERVIQGLGVQGYKQANAQANELLRNAQATSAAYQDESEFLGMSNVERAKAIALREVELKYAKEIAKVEQMSATTDVERAEKQKALDTLAQAQRIEGEAAVSKVIRDDWTKTTDQINQSLTDALLRGFESGKDFAQNLRDTLKNMFSTMILRPVISAVLSPISGAISGAVGSAVGGSGIGSSIATSLGTSALGSAFSLGLSNFGTGLGSSLANGLFSGIGTNISNFGTLAGAGNLSGALGVAAPYLAGIGAIAAIISSLDDSGTYHTGGAAQYNASGLTSGSSGAAYNIGFGQVESGASTITAVGSIAQGIGAALNAVATSFGQTAGYEIATAFADDRSEDGAWGALRISKDGQDLLNWNDTRMSKWAPREFGDGEAGYKEYLAAVAKDTRQVLLDMELPEWADTMLTNIGESASMEDLQAVITQIGVIQTAFVSLGESMQMFSGLTSEMQSGLLEAAGSIDALTAGASAFYQGFYSDQERMDNLAQQLRDSLSEIELSIDPSLGDDAKEQFRRAVEAAFAAGDAELAASLLAISGNFATAADYFEQLSQSAAQAAEQAAQAAAEAARQAALDAAAAYFAPIDRATSEQGYLSDAQSALDALFGSVSDVADSSAQASADAAQSAADSWRSAASSIKSSIEKLRADTTSLSDPASRYAETKSILDQLTSAALGGDAGAAEKLSGAADAFLQASAGGTITQAEYLRDRVLTEAKLASVLDTSEAQASMQESIAAAANASVSELQKINTNLSGFAGDLYELLQSQYSGVGRDQATTVAGSLAKMQADFDAYFAATTGFGAVGAKYTDASFGGASFTKLDNGLAQFTGASGAIDYIRAGESLLDVARRIPELRALWEKQYGISLPSFDVGTNYVQRDMVAQIHQGEAILPKAFNPWAGGNSVGSGNDAALISALSSMSGQLSAVNERLAKIEESNEQMAQQQDNGTDGGNAYRAEIMNVDALAKAIKEATV